MKVNNNKDAMVVWQQVVDAYDAQDSAGKAFLGEFDQSDRLAILTKACSELGTPVEAAVVHSGQDSLLYSSR